MAVRSPISSVSFACRAFISISSCSEGWYRVSLTSPLDRRRDFGQTRLKKVFDDLEPVTQFSQQGFEDD
jgi:hypothetical protein